MTKNQTIDLLKNQLPGFYSVEQVINLAKFKENAGLKKTDGKKQVKIRAHVS